MRKSFDGLFGIIKNDLSRDVRDDGLFMFLNSRRNRIKILYWDTDGIAIWMKRLEEGCYQRQLRCADGKHVIITPAELQCILSGVDLSSEVDPIIRTTGGPALDSGRRSFSTPWAIDFPRCLIT